MPAAPPRFTLSPFDERGTHANHRATNHKRPTPTGFHASQSQGLDRRTTRSQSHPGFGVHNEPVDDPVLGSRRALGEAKMPASDLNNVNRLFALMAAITGVLLAVALVQSDVNDPTIASLIKLPGDLYLNAMLCVIVPTVFLNSILASMHFWTLNKAKALFYKLLAYFVLTTLWASIIGVLAGATTNSLFTGHNLKRTTRPITVGKAAITLQCPSHPNASVVIGNNAMSCQGPNGTSNGTALLLQDLSNTFKLRSDPRTILSLAEAMMKLLESFFPANVAQVFLQGDVLGIVIIGAALGIALIQKSAVRLREVTPGFRTPGFDGGAGTNGQTSGQLFLLIMQGEVILSVLLRVLLKALPFALVSIVAGGILVPSAASPDDSTDLSPSTQDLMTLVGVVLLALLLQLSTVMAATMLITKSNPFKYTKHLLPAQLVALSTSSTLVALPTTVRSIAASKQVSMPLAHFVCSSGLALNKNGSALYLSVASVYILVVSGFDEVATNTTNLVLLAIVSMLCSFVIPPMPRGNVTLVATILWSIFGIHDTLVLARMVAFLTAMDWLVNPFVTAVDVTNNCLIALILAVQMDETFIEINRFDTISDTQEEDSNDGFPLDESHHRIQGSHGPTQAHHPARERVNTHGSGTMRPPLVRRTTSADESVVSV